LKAQAELFTVAEELKDTKFMTAGEKKRVLRHWESFLQSGLSKHRFTKALYYHLTQHCSFIAHLDINGFYSTYFEQGDDTVHFLSQFDQRNGVLGKGGKYVPKSVEYGMTYWATDEEYGDINTEMCRIAWKYIPALELKAKNDQRHADLARAEALLKKHGVNLPGGDE